MARREEYCSTGDDNDEDDGIGCGVTNWPVQVIIQ